MTSVQSMGDEPTKPAWQALCDILSREIAGQYFRVAFFIVHRFDIQSSRYIRTSTWSQIDDVLNVLFKSRCLPVPDNLNEDHQLLRHYDDTRNDATLNEVYRILKRRFDLFRSSIKQGLEVCSAHATTVAVAEWSPRLASDSEEGIPGVYHSGGSTPFHPLGSTTTRRASDRQRISATESHVDADSSRGRPIGRQLPWATKEQTALRKATQLARVTITALSSLTSIRKTQAFLAHISDIEKLFLTLFDVIVKAADSILSKEPVGDDAITVRLKTVAAKYLTLIRDSVIAFNRPKGVVP